MPVRTVLIICIIFGSSKSGSEMPPALSFTSFHFLFSLSFFHFLSPLLLWLFGLSYGLIQILGTLVSYFEKNHLDFDRGCPESVDCFG